MTAGVTSGGKCTPRETVLWPLISESINVCAGKKFTTYPCRVVILTIHNSSDFDLATDSADIVHQAYTYNAARRERFCRYTHACVACPIVNERCPSFFRGRRSESDDEDSELNNNDSEVDEVPELW